MIMRDRYPTLPAMDYAKALELAAKVKTMREGRVLLRSESGNIARLHYPDGIVETAAQAATRAPDLSASFDLLDQVFSEAEKRVSDAFLKV